MRCYLLFAILLMPGCAGLEWALAPDPASGLAPAIAALKPAADAGLQGLMSGGLLEGGLLAGLAAFAGTYDKTLYRYYQQRKARNS